MMRKMLDCDNDPIKDAHNCRFIKENRDRYLVRAHRFHNRCEKYIREHSDVIF